MNTEHKNLMSALAIFSFPLVWLFLLCLVFSFGLRMCTMCHGVWKICNLSSIFKNSSLCLPEVWEKTSGLEFQQLWKHRAWGLLEMTECPFLLWDYCKFLDTRDRMLLWMWNVSWNLLNSWNELQLTGTFFIDAKLIRTQWLQRICNTGSSETNYFEPVFSHSS